MTSKTYKDIVINQVIRRSRFILAEKFFAKPLTDADFIALFSFPNSFPAAPAAPVAPASDPSVENFVRSFSKASEYSFFFRPANKKQFFLQTLSSLCEVPRSIEHAENVCLNRVSLFGSDIYNFGDAVDWHFDFKAKQAVDARSFYSAVKLPAGGADIKVPWELSRGGFIWALGKAYWLTGRTVYKEKFAALLSDWQTKNPYCTGANWMSPMEVALRALNWLAGFYFFCDDFSAPFGQSTSTSPPEPSFVPASELQPTFWLGFLKSLYQHGLYLESNLEYTRRNGNHLVADALGLYALGGFFKHSAKGRAWMQHGKKILEEEILTQTADDGVDYEMSVAYHRLVTEFFAAAYRLGDLHQQPFSPAYKSRLEKMLEYVLAYTKPDGAVPLVGDADDGRLFWTNPDEDFNNHTALLSLGAAMLNRSDFKLSDLKFSELALWLLGTDGLETYQKLPPAPVSTASAAFPKSQIFILRNEKAHVFIDAGELGKRGWGGHGHNDTFSFELFANGATFITDSGTYCYTSDAALRKHFRSGKAHNSVMIDDKEIAEFSGSFNVKADRTNPKVIEWRTTKSVDTLSVKHDAYRWLREPVTHQRKFLFYRERNRLEITDQLYGKGTHTADLFFHFAPEIEVEKSSYNKLYVTHRGSKARLEIDFESGGEDIIISDSIVARRYGVTEPAKVLRFRKKFIAQATFVTTFSF